jgi:hypothetical protein
MTENENSLYDDIQAADWLASGETLYWRDQSHVWQGRAEAFREMALERRGSEASAPKDRHLRAV